MYHPEFVVVFDTETTGLSQTADEIVEICAKKYRRADRSLIETFYRLCEPISGFISPEVSAINGITMEKVKGKPSYLQGGVHEEFAAFCQGCRVAGHNIIRFDLGMARISPEDSYDTCAVYKKKFPGKSGKLSTACKNMKIKFDADLAHSAEYDVDRTAELYWVLTEEGIIQTAVALDGEPVVETQTVLAEAVQAQDVAVEQVKPFQRIRLSMDQIKTAVVGMALSYSKIESFIKCPYSWYKTYIEKYKSAEKTYFQVGHVCHEVAEKSAVWCYKQSFSKRFDACIEGKLLQDLVIPPEWQAKVLAEYTYYSMTNLAIWLYEHPGELMAQPKYKSISTLLVAVMDAMDEQMMVDTCVYSVDDVTFEQIFNRAVVSNKVVDPKTINDAKYICKKFRANHSYDNSMRSLIITEKKLAFDENWKVLGDFFSRQARWRSVIDFIEYHKDYILIRDYKTSRTMLSLADLKQDMQLKVYIVAVIKLLPLAKDKEIRVEMNYMRYGKCLSFKVEDINSLIAEVEAWIEGNRKLIEDELLKPISDMYAPLRNEYCHTCDLADNGLCPLFRKDSQNSITDPETFMVKDDATCVMAWKQIEANKAEAKTLTSKVRAYLNSREGEAVMVPITVDKTAELAVWAEPEGKAHTRAATQWLLAKAKAIDIKPADMLNKVLDELSLSEKGFLDICRWNKITFDPVVDQGLVFQKVKNTLGCKIPGKDDVDES